MMLADAHMHLFRSGYHRPRLPSLFGNSEVQAYEALRLIHGIELTLAIGYEADGIDPGNNAYLRQLSQTRPWLRTLAYVPVDAMTEPKRIEALLDAGHAGLSIYALTRHDAEVLPGWPRQCWQLPQARNAVVSFNSTPQAIAALGPLIGAWPGVQFLISHLGLPGIIGPETTSADIEERLRPVLALARLPNAHVKISGLYAMSEPPHANPHRGVIEVIGRVLTAFGPTRCLWASDFAPALEFVSFPQTIAWPGSEGLSEGDRRLVFRDNLVRLLTARQ